MPKSNHMSDASLKETYLRLIQINQETFAGGEYDVAYHALSGAIYCAASLKEINYIVEVERLAVQQLAWIDAHDPEYEHSTESSSKRGLPSIYSNLAKMANAKVLIIQNEAKRPPPSIG
jgi:uncharacterized protein YecT (DUF1311 family)